MSHRVGLGHDLHRLVEGRPLVLGGVHFEHDRGLDGHSDADVLLHAVVDALLGAAGLGDIGDWFPASDDRWKDADSKEMLRSAVAGVRDEGWEPVNVDAIVIAEAPRLGDRKAAMAARIAGILDLDRGSVNVKAKTAEGLGPVGTGEAIEARAVVLLRRKGSDDTR